MEKCRSWDVLETIYILDFMTVSQSTVSQYDTFPSDIFSATFSQRHFLSEHFFKSIVNFKSIMDVPSSRLILDIGSLFPALFRSIFPVPGCLFPAPKNISHVPCSRLFWRQCSLFPAVLGPKFPVPGNPYQSLLGAMKTRKT